MKKNNSKLNTKQPLGKNQELAKNSSKKTPNYLFITQYENDKKIYIYGFNRLVADFLIGLGYRPLEEKFTAVFSIPNTEIAKIKNAALKNGFSEVILRKPIPLDLTDPQHLTAEVNMGLVEKFMAETNKNFSLLTRHTHLARTQLKRQKNLRLIEGWWNFMALPPTTGRHYARIGKFITNYETTTICRFTPTELARLSALKNVGHYLIKQNYRIDTKRLINLKTELNSFLESTDETQLKIAVQNAIGKISKNTEVSTDGTEDEESKGDGSGKDKKPHVMSFFEKIYSLENAIKTVDNVFKNLKKDHKLFKKIDDVAAAKEKFGIIKFDIQNIVQEFDELNLQLEQCGEKNV